MKLQKKVRGVLISGMAGMMAATFVFPAFAAGWTTVGDKKYYYYDNGQMATGLLSLNDTYYYFMPDGSMVTGWLKLDNDYYYMQSDGSLSTGWVQIGSDWYYMLPDSGKCVLNAAMEIDGFWYFFKGDGKRLSGWLKKDGVFYYMDPAANGRMVAGTSWVIDGVTYNFGADGVCTSAVQVSNFYDAGATAAAEETANTATTEETDNYGKTNVIVAGYDR